MQTWPFERAGTLVLRSSRQGRPVAGGVNLTCNVDSMCGMTPAAFAAAGVLHLQCVLGRSSSRPNRALHCWHNHHTPTLRLLCSHSQPLLKRWQAGGLSYAAFALPAVQAVIGEPARGCRSFGRTPRRKSPAQAAATQAQPTGTLVPKAGKSPAHHPYYSHVFYALAHPAPPPAFPDWKWNRFCKRLLLWELAFFLLWCGLGFV